MSRLLRGGHTLALTPTGGWQAARERSDGTKVLFWTTQSYEDIVDDEGELVGDLDLQWAGDRSEIAEVLAATDLIVRVSSSDNEVFYLAPHIIDE